VGGPPIPAAEVVTVLYSALLGRAPDEKGLAYHTALLRNGASAADVAAALWSSEEAVGGLTRSPATRAVRETLWAARQAAAPLAGPPVFFLHIMKTGGTSLVEGLRAVASPRPCLIEIFLDDLVSIPRHVLEQVPLVAGHLGYEARTLLPAQFVTCVVLREPVERTLSHYSHLRRNPDVLAECPDFSLEQFVHSPRWRTLCGNYQARQLVHEIGLGGAWVNFSPADKYRTLGPPFPPEHRLPLQSYFDSSPLSVEGDELLARARERLAAIEFVGVTEQLDTLSAALARGWGTQDPPPLPRLQVGEDRLQPDDVPGPLLDAISEETAVDRALYEEAHRRSPV
jgi:hypothetical protein